MTVRPYLPVNCEHSTARCLLCEEPCRLCVHTSNRVQSRLEWVTIRGLQAEQSSRGVWDRRRQIGFGAGYRLLQKGGIAGQTEEEGRSSRHQGVADFTESGTEFIPHDAVKWEGHRLGNPSVQSWGTVQGRLCQETR